MRIRSRTLAIALLALALLWSSLSPASSSSAPAGEQCILNCVGHRGTLTEITSALKGYKYGPRRITHYDQGKVFWWRFTHRNGHKIALAHIRAAYFPPAAPTARRAAAALRADDCWWNFFDSACFQWNWPRVWEDVSGGDSLAHTVGSCLAGAAHGFQGNLTKAQAGQLLFFTIGSDVTETPFLRATPGGLALATLGHCIWGVWQNR